jgi:ABC-type microcin C transport system permease subunit YejB
VPAFIMITGTRVGKLSHHRWYQLRGLNKKETKQEISSRVWDYVWFGTVAMLLELIPVLSFFFLLTTTAGSAIWTAKMEEQMRVPRGRPAGHEEHDVLADHDDDAPPAYHDNPV